MEERKGERVTAVQVAMLPKLKGFGSGNFVLNLDRGLERNGNRSIKLAGLNSEAEYRSSAHYSKLRWDRWEENLGRLLNLVSSYTERLEDIVTSQDVDVVNIHHAGYPLLLGSLIKARYGVPLVLTVHGTGLFELDHGGEKIRVPDVFMRCVQDFDRIITQSHRQREMLGGMFNQDKTETVHPGVDEFYLEKEEEEDKEQYLYVGRITEEKGIDHLLEIFGELRDKKLVMVGKNQGYDPERLDQPNIDYRGFVSKSDLRSLYRKSKALIMPSLFDEPFGLVAVESMATGTPVITYGNGGISETVNERVGIICSSKDEMKDTIENDRVEFNREKLREHVMKNFSWDKTVSRYSEIYREVMR